MKVLAALLALACIVSAEENKLKCALPGVNMDEGWIDMKGNCTTALRSQVKVEVNAAITYLEMAAFFAKDSVNLPGFSKFFFESASEEREHAIKVIEYLLMRGQLVSDIRDLITPPYQAKKGVVWSNGITALKAALQLEASVTESIRNMIAVCEDETFNDYHMSDYFTGEFLDEQYAGERKLAGRIATLDKMYRHNDNKALAQFLFDKKLLNNEV